MSTLTPNRKSHRCGCTHVNSDAEFEPQVNKALLLKRDLHLGNYLADYLSSRTQVQAFVKSLIKDGLEVTDIDGTIQISTLTVDPREAKTDLDKLRHELRTLNDMVDVEQGRDTRSIHIEDFNGTGKPFTVDYDDTLNHTSPAHALFFEKRSVLSEEELESMFEPWNAGTQGLNNYLEYLEPSRAELFPPEPAAPFIPARTFWSGESCITSTQGGETVVHPGKHSSAQWEGSSLDTLQGKYPEADFSSFGKGSDLPGLRSVTVDGRTVFSVPNTHDAVLGTDGSLSFVESDNGGGSIVYEKVSDAEGQGVGQDLARLSI